MAIQYNLPTPRVGGRDAALEGWIQEHTTRKGLRLHGAVIHMLTDRIGPDLRRIDNELEKLALYAGDRPIVDADVRLLVADMGEEAIWGLTDGLSERNSARPSRTLAGTQPSSKTPFMVMGSIAANYRLIFARQGGAGGRAAQRR